MVISELNPAQGIITDAHPLQVPMGALRDARNVRNLKGRLVNREGYTQMHTGPTVRARFARYFRTATNSPRLIVAGTKAGPENHIYSWNGSSWDEKCASLHPLDTADTALWDAEEWGGTIYLTKQGAEFLYWDGGSGDFLDVSALGSGGSALIPTYIRAFNNRLVGARISLAGTDQPKMVAWSIPGDTPPHNDWQNAGSGWEPRVNLRGNITGLELCGRGLAVFAEESIDMLLQGPSASLAFIPYQQETGLGTYSPHSIRRLPAPYSGEIAFLGSDYNIHVFNGGRSLPVTEGKIHSWLKDHCELNSLDKAWAEVFPLHGVYMLAVATNGATENNAIVEWNYMRNEFYIHEFNDAAQSAWSATARYTRSTPLTWATIKALGTTWAQVRGTWADMKRTTGLDEVAFIGSAGKMVRLFDGNSDGGGAIDAWAEFAPTDGGPEHGPYVQEGMGLEVIADATGASNQVSFSLGSSYDGKAFAYGTRTAGMGPTANPVLDFHEQAGRYHSIKITNVAGAHFGLRGFRLHAETSGEER